MNVSHAPLLLKPEDAAKLLSVGRTQVYAMIASGELESVKIGRLRRVPFLSCERYVQRLAESAPAAGGRTGEAVAPEA